MTNMEFEMRIITPQEAKIILENNKRNRAISKTLVKKYAKMMMEGEWYSTHQSIAIDENGILVDGQHRLLACIEANASLKTIVVRNAKQNPYLDMGKNRNWSDNLNIATDSQRYTKSIAQIYNLLSSIANRRRLDQSFRQRFCDRYYEKMNLANSLYLPGKIRSGGCPMITAIFLNLIKYPNITEIDEKIRDYIYIFNTGNCNLDDKYDIEVKQMRDHFLAGKREFSKFAANTSNSNIRFLKTLYFTKSLQAYLTESHYFYGVDIQNFFQKEIQNMFIEVEQSINDKMV